LRHHLFLACGLLLAGCSSERHFAADTLLPFGDPNRPIASSETAQRALGHTADVTPIAPQAGNVWPGPVQPVPTIAEEEKAMNQPLGDAYTPSLPSPYPPGTAPPPDADLGTGPLAAPVPQESGGAAAPGLAPAGGTQSGTVSSPAQ
jgi:hypothetical protein